jgi:hypothetical protein
MGNTLLCAGWTPRWMGWTPRRSLPALWLLTLGNTPLLLRMGDSLWLLTLGNSVSITNSLWLTVACFTGPRMGNSVSDLLVGTLCREVGALWLEVGTVLHVLGLRMGDSLWMGKGNSLWTGKGNSLWTTRLAVLSTLLVCMAWLFVGKWLLVTWLWLFDSTLLVRMDWMPTLRPWLLWVSVCLFPLVVWMSLFVLKAWLSVLLIWMTPSCRCSRVPCRPRAVCVLTRD